MNGNFIANHKVSTIIIYCVESSVQNRLLMALSGLANANGSKLFYSQFTAILMSFEIAVLLSFARNYNDDDDDYYNFGACKRKNRMV